MSSLKDSRLAFENRLLAALPADEYKRLLPHLEPVRLPQSKIIYRAGESIRHAYFLRGGMASLLSITGDGKTVEVGMIGNEGLVGIPVILRANTSPYQSAVQLTANAMRVSGDALRAEFDRGGRLHDLMLRYLHALLYQVSQSATCNRFHTMEERLCRWLLVSRDRTQTDTLRLTQEFLSQMIGAPRSRVTLVAIRLQQAGLISYSRGRIVIRDRRGLAALSCECYRIVNEQITRFIAA